MTTLSCRHVGKVWPGAGGLSVPALRDIDLTVESGEFVAILGPSGCGKSMLLELIAGLEPLSSGRIALDGKSVSGPAPRAVMVFQDHSLFPWLSVKRNVGFVLPMKNVPRPYRQRRAPLAAVRGPPPPGPPPHPTPLPPPPVPPCTT